MGKKNPLNDADIAEFIQQQKTKPESEKSWNLPVTDIDKTTYDLSVKNPNTPEEAPLRSPQDILTEMKTLDAETAKLLESIEELV